MMRRLLAAAGTYARRQHLAFFALFLALGGTSVAAVKATIPDKGGTIHGCYKTKTGALRVTTAKKCKKGEKALSWAAVASKTGANGTSGTSGANGANGVNGLTGAAGPQGPAGPAGANGSNGSNGTNASLADVTAGGDLTGKYPNPTIGTGKVTADKLADAEDWHELAAANAKAAGACTAISRLCGVPNCDALHDCAWTNVPNYATAGFYKDPYGVVHVKGTVLSGGDGGSGMFGGHAADIFVLPVGYRPAAREQFAVPAKDSNGPALGRVDVLPNGHVTLVNPVADVTVEQLGLDNISFRALPASVIFVPTP